MSVSFHYTIRPGAARRPTYKKTKLRKVDCVQGIIKALGFNMPWCHVCTFRLYQSNWKRKNIKHRPQNLDTPVIPVCVPVRVCKSAFNLSHCLIHSLLFTPDSFFNFKCSASKNKWFCSKGTQASGMCNLQIMPPISLWGLLCDEGFDRWFMCRRQNGSW